MKSWKMNRMFTLILGFLVSLAASAQEVEMAEGMRSEGKIYVVVAVMATIFIGLVVYMITLDRRVKNLEKEKKG